MVGTGSTVLLRRVGHVEWLGNWYSAVSLLVKNVWRVVRGEERGERLEGKEQDGKEEKTMGKEK